MKYRADIDGLRAIAVLIVLVFHVMPSALPGGFVGVDMFFAISGYLITGILWGRFDSGSFSFASFYARRARRLLPALYATLVCTLVTALALFPVAETRATAYSAVTAVASVSNLRFALQAGYFDDSAYQKPLLHTWSLAVEEQFYLFWPLVLKFLFEHRGIMPPALSIFAIISTTWLSEMVAQIHPGMAYFLAPFRAYQFLGGASLHLLSPSSSIALQTAISLPGLLAIACSLYFFSGETRFPGLAGMVPTFGTMLLIHTPNSKVAGFLSNSMLVGIGRISYSVYLVHWPLIVAHRLLSSEKFSFDSAVFLFLASIGLGYALHHSVETRFRYQTTSKHDFRGRLVPDSSARTLFIYAGVGLLICAGAYGVVELANLKLKRIDRELAREASAAKFDNIPGFNFSAATYWTRRTNMRRDKDVSVVVLNKRSYRLTYRPAGGPAQGRMLLIGDSHALNMQNAFMRFAIERSFNFDSFTRGGCVPLLNLSESKYKESEFRTKACMKEQRFWQSTINNTPYDFVVVVSRLMNIFEGKKYGDFEQRLSMTLHSPGSGRPPANELRARFDRAFRETVDVILKSGASVIAVTQWPHLGRTVRGCLELPGSKQQLRHRAQPTACVGVPRHHALERSRFMDNLLTKIGNTKKRFTAIVASKYFCDNWADVHCRSVYQGKELYYDQNHLSPLGSMFLAQRWAQDGHGGVDWNFRNDRALNGTVLSSVRLVSP